LVAFSDAEPVSDSAENASDTRCGMWMTLFAFAILAFVCLNVSALLIDKQAE
jgi:hypothetical protein